MNQKRREKARLPEDVHHVEKWRLALEMIDELIAWGHQAAGDPRRWRLRRYDRAAHGVGAARPRLRAGRQGRDLRLPRGGQALSSRRSPRAAAVRRASATAQDPSSLKELALAAGKKAAVTVTWREGTRGKMSSRFLALRVRPANIDLRRHAHKAGEELPVRWLICEWPSKEAEPTKYWLSNLPADTPLKELVRLAKMRLRIEQDYRELKDALGLDHFEGRTYPGWNHHVTLVSVAHAFLTLERRRRPPTRAAA